MFPKDESVYCRLRAGKLCGERQDDWCPGNRLVAEVLLVTVCLCLTLSSSLSGQDQQVSDRDATARPEAVRQKVILFTGSNAGNPFWNLFTDYMQAAAEQLNIDAEVVFADGDRENVIRLVRRACSRTPKPDAILLQSFKRTGLEVLEIADQENVPIFLVNSGLTESQLKEVGQPRSQITCWIGQMLPNDRDAGKQLAQALIQRAQETQSMLGPDEKIHMIAVNGIRSDSVSVQREQGLMDAIAENENVVLDQIVAADWEQGLAQKRCQILLRRYPHVSVIWSCSDHMAVGAIEAVKSEGRTPGQDVLIGGVDATPQALDLIEQGLMFATIGGHFQEGGWVMALLHDYFHDFDFAPIGTCYDSQMMLVTEKNIEQYRSLVTRENWEQIDFTKFSRHHHPQLQQYPFDAVARLPMPASPQVRSFAPTTPGTLPQPANLEIESP